MATEQGEHLRVLRTNIGAIQTLVDTVAGTLGPKGLDILLVDESGRMVLTNDGIEILRQSDFQHPAARLAIAALQAQEQKIGDGTTTATVLTGALLGESLRALEQGVPVNLLLKGIARGIAGAITHLQATAEQVTVADQRLYQTTLIAARGDATLAMLIWQAAQHVGTERLCTNAIQLREWVVSRVGGVSELIPGVVVAKRPLNPPLDPWQATGRILVLADGLEPENLDTQTLATDAGFSRYLDVQQQFLQRLKILTESGIRLVVTEKSLAPVAEAFLYEHNILVLVRVISRDRERICRLSGAYPLKSSFLSHTLSEILPYLGQATLMYQPATAHLTLANGQGEAQATIMVGAISAEVAAEQERIAQDAAGALQAALGGGIITGGGVAELSCQTAVQTLLDQTEDLSRYGLTCVYRALAQPLEHIIRNSGYAPLEKITQISAAQKKQANPNLGLDCETGAIVDLAQQGIFDPVAVKIQALSVAGEIALRILRIQTLIRKRIDQPLDS